MTEFKVQVNENDKILNEDGEPVVEIREDDIVNSKKPKPGNTEPLNKDWCSNEFSSKRIKKLKETFGEDFSISDNSNDDMKKNNRKSVKFDDNVKDDENDYDDKSNNKKVNVNRILDVERPVKDSVIEKVNDDDTTNNRDIKIDEGNEDDDELFNDDDYEDDLDLEADLMEKQIATAYHNKRNLMIDQTDNIWDKEVVPEDASLAGIPPPKSKFERYMKRSFNDKMINENGEEEDVSIMVPRLIPGMNVGKVDNGIITTNDENENEWDEYTNEAKNMIESLKLGDVSQLPQLKTKDDRVNAASNGIERKPPKVEHKPTASNDDNQEQSNNNKAKKVSRFKANRMNM